MLWEQIFLQFQQITNMYKQIITFIFLAFNLFFTFGYDCSILTTDVEQGSSADAAIGAPDPRAMVCIIARVINVFVGVGAVAFVYMILFGAFKLSMAQGDPKGYIGAQNTWFYALIGFLIVVGFFSVYLILANTLGLPTPGPNLFLNRIEEGIAGFMEAACVCVDGVCPTTGCDNPF
jgi:hypothetical protein